MEKNTMIRFTKQDFLTPTQLATKLGADFQQIRESMRTLFVLKKTIIANNHKTPLITMHGRTYKIHPLGISVFQEYFNQRIKQ